nr:hypothetical protein [Tanacetum cinerariifolium]
MDRRPMIIVIHSIVGSSDWTEVLRYFCHKAAAEDRRFSMQMNFCVRRLADVCEYRINLANELCSVRSVIAPVKAAKLLNDTLRKDEAKMAQLRELERQLELRALEKELFIQKLVRNACIHILLKKRIMTSMPKCGALRDAVGGWDWVKMMSLYCQSSTADKRNFAERLSNLLWEMINAYDKKVEFIWKLEAVPGIATTVKTAKFLNENLWKDDKRIRKLRNMNIDAGMKAGEMENFVHKL